MAIGNNVDQSDVAAELGMSPFSPQGLSVLCGSTGQNQFSFYGPGDLYADGSDQAVINFGTMVNNLGDFRQFNQSSNDPKSATDFTLNWGPSGSTTSSVIPAFPEAMNIKNISTSGTHLTYKFYYSSANRDSESGSFYTFTTPITFNTITPLSGHTRNQTQRANSTQTPNITSIPTGGMSTPNDLIYVETYISNNIGTRICNLGSSRSRGYTTITFHKLQSPYITASGNITPPPSGWTAAFPELNTSSTPVCGSVSNINVSFGSSAFSFYVHIRGIDGINQKIAQATSATITLSHSGGSQVVYSGSMSHTASTFISGSRSSGTWAYDEVGSVTIGSVTWGASSTTC